jgi:hypothetical protein
MRVRARLSRLEQRTRGLTRKTGAELLDDEELRRSIDLLRRCLEGGAGADAAWAELHPIFRRVGIVDEAGRFRRELFPE